MNRFESHLTIGLVLICCSNTSSLEVFKMIFGGLALLFIVRAVLDSLKDEE